MSGLYSHRAIGWDFAWRLPPRGGVRVCAETAQEAGPPPVWHLKFCVHTTCQQQGGQQIAKFARDLALDNVEVFEKEGCFGNCGNGPNALLVELPAERLVRLDHLGTPAAVVQALREHCGINLNDTTLHATELRVASVRAALEGKVHTAVDLLTQALQLEPSLGRHVLLSTRADVRLAAGDAVGALEDAAAAVLCAPPSFTAAAATQVAALLELGHSADAAEALRSAAERCPEWAAGAEHQELAELVQQELQGAAAQAQA